MKTHRHFAAFAAGLLAFGMSNAGHAQFQDSNETAPELREYRVEVIVFRYADGVNRGTELFAPDPPEEADSVAAAGDEVPEFGDNVSDGNAEPAELTDNGDIEPAYSRLSAAELSLGETLDRLERLDAYQPVLHFGWRQRLEPFAEPEAIPLADLAAPGDGLTGQFTLYLSRFLHLDVELAQAADPGSTDPRLDRPRANPFFTRDGDASFEYNTPPRQANPPVAYYRIKEDRIFKSGDIRYFDHPEFGVLARVDRIEATGDAAPEPEIAEEMLGDGPVTP